MFNLSKRQNKITKLYQESSPRERIQRLFEEKLGPFLLQHNFRFVKSQNSFKRKLGNITHEIYISKSKWNRGDEVCSFWLTFLVSADNYNNWHKKTYGILPINNCITGFSHTHLKNWETEFPLTNYNLSNQDNEKVFSEIRLNLEKVILPIFDQFFDYEKSADTLMQEKQYWWAAKIYDYYIIADKPEKAKQALIAGKKYYDDEADPQKESLEAFKVRLQQI